MSLADRLALPPVPTVEPRPTPHPKGWEPGTVWESDRAAAITTPAIGTIDPSDGWDEVLIAAGLDPVKWVVIPPVAVSPLPKSLIPRPLTFKLRSRCSSSRPCVDGRHDATAS